MSSSSLNSSSHPYYGPERMVISIDVGNSFSSVCLAHLTFGCTPSSLIRTVASYPSFPSSTATPPLPSRHPSAIYYDRHDRARAFGAEVTTPLARVRAKAEAWLLVDGWKEQMRPADAGAGVGAAGSKKEGQGKKLAKKSAKSSPFLSASPSAGSAGLLSTPGASGSPLTRSVTPESLVDAAVDAEGWEVLEEPSTPKGGKRTAMYNGPLIRTIYADLLRHLVACARAWFAETTPSGEEIFLRLWESAIFVLTHPADWGPVETAQLREGLEQANLLPRGFKVGRLIFVKEPTAIVYFARRHTRDADSRWLQEGTSFALCDAADHGTSIISFTVSSLTPKLKLRAYEAVSRLAVGAASVRSAFSALLVKRLAKSKLGKQPSVVQAIMDEFDSKVKTRFSGVADSVEGFRLRFATEGEDKSAGVSGGCIMFTGRLKTSFGRRSMPYDYACLRSYREAAPLILLAGGFGESPYVQRRLKEVFNPAGIAVVVPDVPSHTAVAEGAARFFFAETVGPRPTRFDIGISSAVDWSSNWEKGSEREVFTSVSGQRFVLGKWTAVVKQGTILDPLGAVEKDYNVKHVLSSPDTTFSVQLFAHDPTAEPATDGWMTELDGKPRPTFMPICTVTADLASLIAVSTVRGAEEGKQWVQMDLKLVIYVGRTSLEAAVSWLELGEEKRGPTSEIPSEYF